MKIKHLKEKYNLSDLEIFTQDSSINKVSFVANKIKHLESENLSGIALRLVKNKKIGFSSCMGRFDLEELTLRALEVSEFSPEVSFEFPQTIESRFKNIIKKTETSYSIKDFFNLCKEEGQNIIETISPKAPEALLDISFDNFYKIESVENSNGLSCSHSENLYSISINIRETLENDFIEMFTAVTDSSFPDYLYYVNEILKFYKFIKKHTQIKSGEYPVLFTSKGAKELFNLVELALNGKQINEKSSPWHDKTGKKVLSKLITIKQDPAFGYMARKLDDEGNPIKSMKLINNGTLENFYFDALSSKKSTLQCSSTGNGFRASINSQPEPSLLNMVIGSGQKSPEEIIRNIDYGLLVDQTIGGLTTNISGEMSVNVDIGFLIEKGELVGRVKDTMISGNIYEVLNNVVELSNNSHWYWSNIYNPDILVEHMSITSQKT